MKHHGKAVNKKISSSILITFLIVITLAQSQIFSPEINYTTHPSIHHSSVQSEYSEKSPISINGNNDFAFQAGANGWAGNGSEINPYIIRNLNITSTSNSTVLADVSNTDVYFRIEGSIFSGGSFAIDFSNVTNALVCNNSFQDYSLRGISISGSYNTKLENNSISKTTEGGVGVFFSNCQASSISNNTIESGGEFGIVMDYSSNCSVFYNDLSSQTNSGILVRDSDRNRFYGNNIHHNGVTGIILGNANYCNITENIIFNNYERAIDIQESSHTIIQNNLIYDHPDEGVKIIGPSSIIQNNTFFNNSLWALQLYSAVINITFNNFIDNGAPVYGGGDVEEHKEENNYDYNYWSDWSWPDRNNDSIVDNPKYITNTQGTYDYHPVTVPYIDLRRHIISNPNILVPNDDDIEIHTSSNITWIPSGDTFGHTLSFSLYYKADDAGWIEIASNLSVNYYYWDMLFLPARTNLTLRVTATCSSGYSVDSYSITHIVLEHTIRGLVILKPEAGDVLSEDVWIRWYSSGCTVNDDVFYRLYYSNDGGNSWITIVEELLSNDTSYLWKLYDIPPGSNYMIKVVAECSSGIMVEAITNGTFTISTWPGFLDNSFWKSVIATSIVLSVIVILVYFFRRRKIKL